MNGARVASARARLSAQVACHSHGRSDSRSHTRADGRLRVRTCVVVVLFALLFVCLFVCLLFAAFIRAECSMKSLRAVRFGKKDFNSNRARRQGDRQTNSRLGQVSGKQAERVCGESICGRAKLASELCYRGFGTRSARAQSGRKLAANFDERVSPGHATLTHAPLR